MKMSQTLWFALWVLGGCAAGADSGTVKLEDSGPACNGHAELCDRTVRTVTFAGTHNSMSNADAGWLGPNQQHGLTQQLNDGIRAMMLDTYRWEGDLWLCHGYCDLGAQPLVEGLGELATFLDSHPDEVVQIIFQDAIAIEDTQSALAESGLAPRLYAWADGADPTLGQLIDAQTNLIVGLESGASDDAGLHAAWELYADTPYSFSDPAEFSCVPNRGSEDSALFLVNHWIGNPLPSAEASADVNAESVLLGRAQACAEERGRPVNFLGVDFYDQGDLFAVVDVLNGVASD